jgi:anthranilate phosphoribosyltransferase
MGQAMRELVEALVTRERACAGEAWEAFWNALAGGQLSREDAVAVLASLSARTPDGAFTGALLQSLLTRREQPRPERVVNIVGTGGGPSTFNVSTASALVAASLGVRVIKTGSRGYTSRHGSIDALELLGVPIATSYERMRESLERFRIAFTGRFVYPPELALLAKRILPLDIRRTGRLFNDIGPLLAAVPVSAQVTGVSDSALVPLLYELASQHTRRIVWLCFNGLGVDELVSFEDNTIRRSHASGELRVTRATLGLAPGSLADLRPALDSVGVVRQLEALLQGDGPVAAVESICLNAAALLVAGGACASWPDAIGATRHAVAQRRPRELLRRLQSQGPKRVRVARGRA